MSCIVDPPINHCTTETVNVAHTHTCPADTTGTYSNCTPAERDTRTSEQAAEAERQREQEQAEAERRRQDEERRQQQAEARSGGSDIGNSGSTNTGNVSTATTLGVNVVDQNGDDIEVQAVLNDANQVTVTVNTNGSIYSDSVHSVVCSEAFQAVSVGASVGSLYAPNPVTVLVVAAGTTHWVTCNWDWIEEDVLEPHGEALIVAAESQEALGEAAADGLEVVGESMFAARRKGLETINAGGEEIVNETVEVVEEIAATPKTLLEAIKEEASERLGEIGWQLFGR